MRIHYPKLRYMTHAQFLGLSLLSKELTFIFLFAITAAGVVLTTKKQVRLCGCELIHVSAFIVCKIMTNLGIPSTGLNQSKPRQRHIYHEHFQTNSQIMSEQKC